MHGDGAGGLRLFAVAFAYDFVLQSGSGLLHPFLFAVLRQKGLACLLVGLNDFRIFGIPVILEEFYLFLNLFHGHQQRLVAGHVGEALGKSGFVPFGSNVVASDGHAYGVGFFL